MSITVSGSASWILDAALSGARPLKTQAFVHRRWLVLCDTGQLWVFSEELSLGSWVIDDIWGKDPNDGWTLSGGTGVLFNWKQGFRVEFRGKGQGLYAFD